MAERLSVTSSRGRICSKILCLACLPFLAATASAQEVRRFSSTVESPAAIPQRQSRLAPIVQQTDCDQSECDALPSTNGSSFTNQASHTSKRWTLRADTVFLYRQKPSANTLAFNTNNPAQELNASDFPLGIHTGFDLLASRQFTNGWGIEARYFGFDHWNTNVSSQTNPGDLLQINSAIPLFTLAGDSFAADYQSALHNAELSLLRGATENISLLGGFRYLELDERLGASSINSQIPLTFVTGTRNRLYGFQLGGKLHLWEGNCVSLAAIGKGGLYANRTAQNGSFATGAATLGSSGRDTTTAFVGELGFLGNYRLTDRISVHGGYNLLWLTDVAVASNQLASSNFFNGTGLSNNENLFYNGATTGLEYSW